MPYPYNNVVVIATTSTATSRTLSGKCKELMVSASKDCYINFDATTATAAGSLLIEAGVPYTFPLLYVSKVNVIRASDDGVLSIMEFGDVVLHITESDSFTGDANLSVKALSTTYTGNASLLIEIADSFVGDTSLKIVSEATVTGDTSILKETAAEYTGDANLYLYTNHAATYTGNASLAVNISDSFLGDSNLLDDKHVGTFNGDAKLITY